MPSRTFEAIDNGTILALQPITVGMGFQFDAEKDAANRQKHGYALDSGRHLMEQMTSPFGALPPAIYIDETNRNDGEPRTRLLTLDGECQIVDFVFTIRNSDQSAFGEVRAISYRRAS